MGPLDFVHRKTTEEDCYFIYNRTAQAQALTCRFRAATGSNGRVPEFWWPDSGRRSSCEHWKSLADGRTEVPVTLAPSGSVFVVFRKPDAALDPIARDSFVAAASPAPMLVEGPWHVAFPEGWGTPPEATFDPLQSWTESDNEGIRFFSGMATYRKSIEIPEPLAKQDRLFLELGDLAEIAEVTLNGKNLGRVWLPPYRVEISGVARAGSNELEIRVANLWASAQTFRIVPDRQSIGFRFHGATLSK